MSTRVQVAKRKQKKYLVISLKGLAAKMNCLASNCQLYSNSDSVAVKKLL
jgi:hypothetical protein